MLVRDPALANQLKSTVIEQDTQHWLHASTCTPMHERTCTYPYRYVDAYTRTQYPHHLHSGVLHLETTEFSGALSSSRNRSLEWVFKGYIGPWILTLIYFLFLPGSEQPLLHMPTATNWAAAPHLPYCHGLESSETNIKITSPDLNLSLPDIFVTTIWK